MGRKAFLDDLRTSSKPGQIINVTDIRSGDDDGEICFTVVIPALPQGELFFKAIIPDVSEYPRDHDYFILTDDGNPVIPKPVSMLMESVSAAVRSLDVQHMMRQVAEKVISCIASTQKMPIILVDSDDEAEEEEQGEDEEMEDFGYDSDEGFDDGIETKTSSRPTLDNTSSSRNPLSPFAVPRSRIRADLAAAKEAGFKVSSLGDISVGGFICVSVRIVKLGISEEAMQAWGLERSHYLVLMIKFSQGYRTLEQVSEESVSDSRKTEIRVALSRSYKPSLQNAINAFAYAKDRRVHDNDSQQSHIIEDGVLENLFIGGPINALLNERFPAIVRYRLACALPWKGAELFYHDCQGKSAGDIDAASPRYNQDDGTGRRALPPISKADHIGVLSGNNTKSLPLAAMQFLIRHVVRCTEFCLVCHCAIDNNLEALKPYVCSKPLCLFQYLTFGLGPSIEWEIKTQPFVVDLLVSFCYSRARSGRLEDFPDGIALRVPNPSGMDLSQYSFPPQNSRKYYDPSHAKSTKPATLSKSSTPIMEAKYDDTKCELIFADRTAVCPVKTNDWVMISSKVKPMSVRKHFRVDSISLWPVVSLSKPGVTVGVETDIVDGARYQHKNRDDSLHLELVECDPYHTDFDTLSPVEKRAALISLLDTLPGILDLQAHLHRIGAGRDLSLRGMRNSISESSLNVLRWIIASNRSCIIETDKVKLDEASEYPLSAPGSPYPQTDRPSERVYGMDGWMQFKFAMGAPDKEQRFLDAVRKNQSSNFPTIFAWHGSGLQNWHSIIREGLHFNDIHHGRAYGNGVYMSPQLQTSLGYSGGFYPYTDPHGSRNATGWPNSILRINTAMALNEVVNKPESFVSRSPHYVVADLDWIQTRYLFVKVNNKDLQGQFSGHPAPKQAHAQQPGMEPLSESNAKIILPASAVSKSRRQAQVASPKSMMKRIKHMASPRQADQEDLFDDDVSLATLEEDRDLLLSSDDEHKTSPISVRAKQSKRKVDDEIKTDFKAGMLDVSKLKTLEPPSDSSSHTTQALLRAFRDTIKVQQREPMHELGWHIEPEQLDNPYQWIVELHSFDAKLPLAQDMKKSGISSIVLEMLFTNQFPFAPPFVRIIQPRFLPFMNGGGGNVTLGGAICMELLTSNGWLPTTTIESTLFQIRMALSDTERPAKLENARVAGHQDVSYNIGEAFEAYRRLCGKHGWKVPEGFEKMTREQAKQDRNQFY